MLFPKYIRPTLLAICEGSVDRACRVGDVSETQAGSSGVQGAGSSIGLLFLPNYAGLVMDRLSGKLRP